MRGLAILCLLSSCIVSTVMAQDCNANRPFDIEFWKFHNMVRL